MKKLFILILPAFLLLSSCGIHQGLTTNVNNHITEVVLSENNFKVLETVRGDSEHTYFFGIGGLKKEALIAEARAEMLANSHLEGSSKAVINETVEIKRSIVLIFIKYSVTVSAHVIEFID